MSSRILPPTINEIFPEQFSKVDCKLIPPAYKGAKIKPPNYKVAQDKLCKVIDALGLQSAAAQGLSKAITTVEKLRAVHNHHVYLLKDSEADEGRGEIIAMLKFGYKHLFLFDTTDKLRELEPPCVLDFYVVSSFQRQGHGRTLFDYMLHDMDIMLPDLAIDGPSENMVSFMNRNYGIDHLVPQNNNFAVLPGFFDHIESGASKVRLGPPEKRRPPMREFPYRAPTSSVGMVIHGEPGGPSNCSEGYDDPTLVQSWNEDYTEWSPDERSDDDAGTDSESDYEPAGSRRGNPGLDYQPW